MSFLKSLPSLPDVGLLQIFQTFPEHARPLIDYHEVLMRGDSPFTAAERELIAAYVSGLNGCRYCHAVHAQTAVELGIGADVIPELLINAAVQHIDLKMRPVISSVRKLTLSPEGIMATDADAVFAAGWDDRALHDATAICALFNLMNRLVNGLGVERDEKYTKMAAQRLARGGYAQLADLLPASPK